MSGGQLHSKITWKRKVFYFLPNTDIVLASEWLTKNLLCLCTESCCIMLTCKLGIQSWCFFFRSGRWTWSTLQSSGWSRGHSATLRCRRTKCTWTASSKQLSELISCHSASQTASLVTSTSSKSRSAPTSSHCILLWWPSAYFYLLSLSWVEWFCLSFSSMLPLLTSLLA